MNRRGLLRLLGAAPVALPVVAREAAAKAGIGTLGLAAPAYPSQPCGSAEDESWVGDWVKRVFSKEFEKEAQRNVGSVGTLDPDLASSRSFSISTAVRIQRERNVTRYIAGERERASERYLKAFGIPFITTKG